MISVVILSYNTRDITLRCLAHLFKSTFTDFEVILIDNASTDGSAETIAKRFPTVKLTKNRQNVGFAVGNNQGMAKARGDKILLLNSDCFVKEDTLAKCISENVDVLGCKLLNTDGSIQPSYGFFVSLRRIGMLMSFVDNLPIIKKVADSIHVRDLSRYQTVQNVDWVTGAFVLLKREIFQKVGGIDEKYFMYGEEMEWMYRIKKAGYKIEFFPGACATHLQGASTKSLSKMFVSEMKGYMYWFAKHRSALAQVLLKIIIIKGCLFKVLVWTTVGKVEMGREYFQTFKEISKG